MLLNRNRKNKLVPTTLLCFSRSQPILPKRMHVDWVNYEHSVGSMALCAIAKVAVALTEANWDSTVKKL